jgi:hypothetical protein
VLVPAVVVFVPWPPAPPPPQHSTWIEVTPAGQVQVNPGAVTVSNVSVTPNAEGAARVRVIEPRRRRCLNEFFIWVFKVRRFAVSCAIQIENVVLPIRVKQVVDL